MLPYIEVFSIKFPTFPIFLLTAFYTCLFVIIKSNKYDNIFYKRISGSIPWAIVFSVISGKTLYIFTRLDTFPFKAINLLNGFVFLGGFYGALLGILVYCKVYAYNYLDITDVFASVLPLGQAIGRIGCFCNGCCYGKRWDGILSILYPVDGEMISVVPTWFIESFFCLIYFIITFKMSGRKRRGFYTYLYMIMYSIFRFFLELFRGDNIRGYIGVLSTSQIICIFTLIAGIIIFFVSSKNEPNMIIIERRKNNGNK